ncbi:hypothetical protein BZA05DRAFT_386421 [Tricharina praecox]|uniref:uncharacterized protein n=1 Tax=Tricharina praecox TaxID=43433 RepID=UPI00221F7D2E|nr:uncharacterized protein BZA05DRAFT_386421 [Tricharina praecox]KAI5856866.1 hypothetical protein BZA05DRAFT_386421 [Tricharina praecox]
MFIQLNTRLCSWKYRQLHSTILLTSRKNNATIRHDERPSIGLSAAIQTFTRAPETTHRSRPTLGPPSSRHSFQSQTKSNSRLTSDPIPSRTTGRSTSSSTGRSNSSTGRSSSSSTGRTTSRSTGCTTNLNSSCPSSSRSPEKCQAGRETSA